MRVITGTARGKRLITREGDAVRPTPERVKEALFSAIQFEIERRRVLDLFAGSGQLGIEALSRGAKDAVFVDMSRMSAQTVRENLEKCGFLDRAKIEVMEYALFLMNEKSRFDLAFLDPPYRTGILQRALPLTAARMNPGGIIVCEHPVDEDMPEETEGFRRSWFHHYGKVALTMYRRKGVTES